MIRFIFLIVLFLISLLAIFKAQAYYLWLMAIIVTELPWILIGITLLLLLLGFRTDKFQLAGSIIGLVALILFLSTIYRAYLVSNELSRNMDAAFSKGNNNIETVPYRFWRSIFHDNIKEKYSTMAYKKYEHITLNLDFYPSQILGKKPCIIVIHGGSWSTGDSRQIPELNSLLTTKGYNVVSINYRKAPKYKTPAPIEDLKNAMNFLRQHSDSLQIDTNNFVLLGRSAGAQVALLAAYSLRDSSIKGVIDFYGPADMVWGYSMPTNPLVMDSQKVMENYIGGTYKEVPQKFADCSPLEFVDKHSPPTLMIHGENDVLVAYDHSRRLKEKLQQKGVKHFWLQLPWATHGFDYIQNGPGGQLANFSIEHFLQYVIK